MIQEKKEQILKWYTRRVYFLKPIRFFLWALLYFLPTRLMAQEITEQEMQAIYDEVRTPYKYGLVMAPT